MTDTLHSRQSSQWHKPVKCVMQFKSISYLHQSVSAGTHECVHHTIKGIVVRISSHVTNSFAWGGKGLFLWFIIIKEKLWTKPLPLLSLPVEWQSSTPSTTLHSWAGLHCQDSQVMLWLPLHLQRCEQSFSVNQMSPTYTHIHTRRPTNSAYKVYIEKFNVRSNIFSWKKK